jgi:hypothetical protein
VKDGVKIAAIAAIAALGALSAWIYFSPYQTCVRASVANGWEGHRAQIVCAR